MTGILLSLLSSRISGGFTVVQTFTATSTWTCPTGVTSVDYLVVGGGGGGAAGRIAVGGGGGGGAGGFRTGAGLAVTAGTDYTITVGGGGAGVATGITSNNGNDSYIQGTVYGVWWRSIALWLLCVPTSSVIRLVNVVI